MEGNRRNKHREYLLSMMVFLAAAARRGLWEARVFSTGDPRRASMASSMSTSSSESALGAFFAGAF
jgi:hypothetical protein